MKNLFFIALLFAAFTSIAQVPNYAPSNGLVGWWGFNGNANDESVNANNGTVNGATLTTDRFGNANSAYDFDGVDDFISLSGTANIDFTTGLTFGAWINSNAIKMASVVDKETDCVSWGYRLNVRNNASVWTEHACYGAVQPGAYTAVASSYSTNVWYFVVGTLDLVNGNRIYLNGQLIDSGPISQTASNSKTIEIGKSTLIQGEYFDGKIDDIGIWNRALDSCEIKDLYEGSLGNCCAPNPITSQPTDITVPLNGSGMFSTATSITSPSYQWQMDNGTGYMDLTNAGQFSGVDTDILTVSNVTLGQNNTLFRCIVSENSNCSDTTDVAVLTVEDNTGLDDLNKDIFNVYPNPTTNSFTISSDNLINSEFKIIDAQGREVLTGSMNGQEHTIDISKLSKGVYSVVFEQQNLPVVSVIKE